MVMMQSVNSDTHSSQLSPNSSPASPKSNSSPDITNKFQKIESDHPLQSKVDNTLITGHYPENDDVIDKSFVYVAKDLHDLETSSAKFSIERLKQLTDHSINRLSPSDDSNSVSGKYSSDQRNSNNNNNNIIINNNNNRSISPSRIIESPQRKQHTIDIEINPRNFGRQTNNMGIGHHHHHHQFQIKQMHVHPTPNHHSIHQLAHHSTTHHLHQQLSNSQQEHHSHTPNPPSTMLRLSPQQQQINSSTAKTTVTTISSTSLTTNTNGLDIERIKLATAAAAAAAATRTITNGGDLSDYGFRIQLGGLPATNYARSDTSEELIVDGNEDSTSQDAPSVS